MVDLKLSDDEGEMLLNLIQNYMPELEVEIHRTEQHEFREVLEKKERFLKDVVRRLGERRKVA